MAQLSRINITKGEYAALKRWLPRHIDNLDDE